MSLQFTLSSEHSTAEINVDVFPNGIGWVAYSPEVLGNNGVVYREPRCIDESAGSFSTELDAQKDAIEWFGRHEEQKAEEHEQSREDNKHADWHELNRE